MEYQITTTFKELNKSWHQGLIFESAKLHSSIFQTWEVDEEHNLKIRLYACDIKLNQTINSGLPDIINAFPIEVGLLVIKNVDEAEEDKELKGNLLLFHNKEGQQALLGSLKEVFRTNNENLLKDSMAALIKSGLEKVFKIKIV